MQCYKIVVAYDGTDYHGWQIQPHDSTVVGCLQEAWFRIFKNPISIIGASRTDAGVHALGQVAHFRTPLSPALSDVNHLRFIWNTHLPNSITIRNIERVNHNFHACKNVVQKTYLYTLFMRKPLPFVSRFGWHYRFIDEVDREKFYKCLQLYKGTHDFGSFCKIEDNSVTTIRTIDEVSVKHFSQWGALMISIKGPGFARFQIRRMIGYALDVARRPKLSVEHLQDLLKNPNPQQTLTKAESVGLCLRKVLYNEHF